MGAGLGSSFASGAAAAAGAAAGAAASVGASVLGASAVGAAASIQKKLVSGCHTRDSASSEDHVCGTRRNSPWRAPFVHLEHGTKEGFNIRLTRGVNRSRSGLVNLRGLGGGCSGSSSYSAC